MATHGDHDHGHGQPVTPRAAATWVARRLRDAGFRALFAGGCVRDALLGLEPADHDVATDATPEAVRRVFPRAIGVGEAFGVMLVRHGGRTVEVATFRADGSYADGRRPDPPADHRRHMGGRAVHALRQPVLSRVRRAVQPVARAVPCGGLRA
jgi:hypothetical protein